MSSGQEGMLRMCRGQGCLLPTSPLGRGLAVRLPWVPVANVYSYLGAFRCRQKIFETDRGF